MFCFLLFFWNGVLFPTFLCTFLIFSLLQECRLCICCMTQLCAVLVFSTLYNLVRKSSLFVLMNAQFHTFMCPNPLCARHLLKGFHCSNGAWSERCLSIGRVWTLPLDRTVEMHLSAQYCASLHANAEYHFLVSYDYLREKLWEWSCSIVWGTSS